MRSLLLPALLRVAFQTAFQYRASFWLEFLFGSANAVGVCAPLLFVYAKVPTVAGWSLPEAMLVTAFFLCFSGMVAGLIEPNLGAVVEGVRTGALDYLLVKPRDAQLVMSFRKIAPAAIWEVLAGIAVGVWALSRVPPPSMAAFGAALVMLFAGVMAVYGLWILVVCLSFWFVRVDNLRYLLGAVTDAGRWPVTVYTGWARVLLTAVIPVALVTSFPAMALLGRLDTGLASQAVGVALGMVVVSRLAWRHAIRHYTSASS